MMLQKIWCGNGSFVTITSGEYFLYTNGWAAASSILHAEYISLNTTHSLHPFARTLKQLTLIPCTCECRFIFAIVFKDLLLKKRIATSPNVEVNEASYRCKIMANCCRGSSGSYGSKNFAEEMRWEVWRSASHLPNTKCETSEAKSLNTINVCWKIEPSKEEEKAHWIKRFMNWLMFSKIVA